MNIDIYMQYKRGISYMAKNKENKNESKAKKIFSHPIVSSVISQVLVAAILFVISSAAGFLQLPIKMNQVEERLNHIEEQLFNIDMDGTEQKISSLTDGMEDINTRINRIEDKLWDSWALILSPTKTSMTNFTVKYEKEKNMYYLNQPAWDSDDIIATDLNGKNQYTAEQLINEKLLLVYTNNGEYTVFLGQFDQNNKWDGRCILNVYRNETLCLVTEAEYDSGELLKYRQILPAEISGGRVWIISDRVCELNFNSGENYCYKRDNDYKMIKKFDDIEAEDVITIENFKEHVEMGTLQSYYMGKTSNGNYNDLSGDAVFVEYFQDGTVKTLYKGKFKDGQFDDTTGKAWYITREKDTLYMYYKGNFKNGKPTHNKGYIFKEEINSKDINEIINHEGISKDLIWYDGNA